MAYVWWFFANGIIIDRVSVLWSFAIFLTVASVGRPPREWMRSAGDLGVFVAMWLAYDESRGIADGLGMPIQVESVRNLDRLLFFGADPVVELQAAFHRTEIAERIRYNPFRDDWFVTAEGVAVKRAERMRFNRNGTVYAIGINSGLQSSSTETQETGATS